MIYDFTFNNVNDAFETLVTDIAVNDKYNLEEVESRVGTVYRFDKPVCITYENPQQCVLLNPYRDANPFFHMYEALWMLAGRNDLAPLKYYVSTFDQFSDDGETLNGAYGYRWYQGSQIPGIIEHLKAFPNSRRAVLQMWNVEDDFWKIGFANDSTKYFNSTDFPASKDVCCNLCVCFAIKYGRLQMTVYNRSNDLIWGTLGANAVHFAFLQAFIANKLEIPTGRYHQITNDLHFYKERWEPSKWLTHYQNRTQFSSPKGYQNIFPISAQHFGPRLEDKLYEFTKHHSNKANAYQKNWYDPYLNDVASPLLHAFHMHKERAYGECEYWLNKVKSKDWQLAGKSWIEQRKILWNMRKEQDAKDNA